MEISDIQKIYKYFKSYKVLYSFDDCGIAEFSGQMYQHKEHKDFFVGITEDNRVYQLVENEMVGIELETFGELEIRFKSFTGQNVKNVSLRLDRCKCYNSDNMLEFARERMLEILSMHYIPGASDFTKIVDDHLKKYK